MNGNDSQYSDKNYETEKIEIFVPVSSDHIGLIQYYTIEESVTPLCLGFEFI